MNNLIIVSGITVSILIVVLLFKLNKTKIEYDNKLLVLNRKVRDLTNLVDLSSTKKGLLDKMNNERGSEEVTSNNEASNHSNGENNTNLPHQLENQYKEFVEDNENFFSNLDNVEVPLPSDIKNDLDAFLQEDLEMSAKSQDNEANESTDIIENVNEEQNGGVEESLENLDDDELLTDLSSNNLGEIADSVETVSTETTEEVEEIIVEQPESESETEVTLDNVDIEVNGDHDNDADTNFGVDNTIEIDMVEISNNGEIDGITMSPLDIDMDMDMDMDVDVNVNVDVDMNIDLNTVNTNEQVDENDISFTSGSSNTLERTDLSDNNENKENNESNNSSLAINLEAMNVKSLQDLCRKYKLKIKGRKDELIERIQGFLSVDNL